MTIPAKVSITQIAIGDSVSPSFANTPHTNLETNIDNILSYLDTSTTGYFEQDTSTTTGLTFGYNAGLVRADSTITIVPAGTILLPATDTSYVEATGAGVISSNITGFTVGSIPLWEITTDGTSITFVTDKRSWITSTDASDLNFTPTSSILSTNVQSAIAEAESNAGGNGLAFSIAFS